MPHRILKIFENLHAFFCCGTCSFRDFEKLLRMFSLTKLLGRQSSIPHKFGNCKENYIEFTLISNIINDGILYGYYLKVLSS